MKSKLKIKLSDICYNVLGHTEWLSAINKEKQHYRLFKDRELNNDHLNAMYNRGYSPIEALNALNELT